MRTTVVRVVVVLGFAILQLSRMTSAKICSGAYLSEMGAARGRSSKSARSGFINRSRSSETTYTSSAGNVEMFFSIWRISDGVSPYLSQM